MSSAKKKKASKKKNVQKKNNISNVNKKEEISDKKIQLEEEQIKKESTEKQELKKDSKKEVQKEENTKNPNSENKSENKIEEKNDDKISEVNKKSSSKEEAINENNVAEEKRENAKIEKDSNENSSKNESNNLITTKSKDEKPEYVQEMLKKKKRRTIIFIFVVIFAILIVVFSTIFALLNLNSNKITKGIAIKNIDISNLTLEEAKEKLKSNLEKELIPDLNLKYNDEYNITLSSEQIEFKYNIDDVINEAYEIGRSENILVNNYALLFTTLFGKEINIDYTYNNELLNAFVDDINSKLPGLVVEPSYYIEDGKLIVEAGKDGIEVEKDKLENSIVKNISSRTLEKVSVENYNQTIDIPVKKVKASNINMDKVYSEIHTEPKDAYFELDPYKIYPDTDGVDLQISLDEAKKQITGNQEKYEFDLKITKAQKTIKDLGTEAFPYLISSFSTRYDASNTNRSTNLRIAAEKINGTVLLPGEVFSYNKTVGKRTVEEGYKDAKIYADGGVVDGLAGGICQISSTLYNAVLLANLEIVERRNHSFTTSYVAAGRDATVVWGTIDFKFKNSRNYPIKIEASVKNGVAEFKMHGMQEEQEYEINIIPKTTSSIPYPTTYVDDPTLLPGQQVVSQAGHLGYKVTTYIVKKLNGAEVSREILSNDTYQPMKAVVRRGIGAPAPVQ